MFAAQHHLGVTSKSLRLQQKLRVQPQKNSLIVRTFGVITRIFNTKRTCTQCEYITIKYSNIRAHIPLQCISACVFEICSTHARVTERIPLEVLCII